MGPAIAAILVSAIGIPVVVVFNALTFLWSALLVSRIRVPSEEPARAAESTEASDAEVADEVADSESQGFFMESTEGFKAIWRDRDLRLVSGVYSARRSSRALRPYSASRWPCR